MKNIVHLLIWFWRGSSPTPNTQLGPVAENRDQSSMADFVRILQAYDHDQYGGS
jgi:hypothetical protein